MEKVILSSLGRQGLWEAVEALEQVSKLILGGSGELLMMLAGDGLEIRRGEAWSE